MKQNTENKSINRYYSTDEGDRPVMGANAAWSPNGINMNFDFLDFEYCMAHKDECVECISGFISRLNALLTEDEYPIIKEGEGA